MNPNYFYIFKNKVILSEVEGEEKPAEETPPTPEKDLDKILNKSKKVSGVLVKMLSTQKELNDTAKQEIKDLLSDIRCISYKPTTFRAILANGNFFDIKYDPTPNQFKFQDDYQLYDGFVVTILGKKYNITNRSEFEQAIDSLQKIQREKAVIVKEPGEGEETPTIPPETPEEEPTPPEEEK